MYFLNKFNPILPGLQTELLTQGGVLSTPPQQNGYNSLKFHATDLKLGSKFSSGRWLQIYEVNKQDLENEKDT